MEEIWIDFNYKGINYKVSNLGNVKGKRGYIKIRLDKDGYTMVTLGNNSKGRIAKRIHRLVAELFLPNPNNLPEVNHKDFNRSNNNVENLEWCTHKDNINYSKENGRYKERDYYGKNNPNYKNNTLKNKYKENPELSKEKNSRPKEENGRAREIYMYDLNMNLINKFSYIGACIDYIICNKISEMKPDSIRGGISNSIKYERPYLKHIFSFEYI